MRLALLGLCLLTSAPALAQNYMDSPGWRAGHAAEARQHQADIAARDKARLAASAKEQGHREEELAHQRDVNAKDAVRKRHDGDIVAQDRAKRLNGGTLPTTPH